MPVAIRVENLSKRFNVGQRHTHLSDLFGKPFGRKAGEPPAAPKELWALRDLSLEIDEGELIGVVGRNGSGKTTLLKILSRITPPTAGKVELYGRVAAMLEVGTGFHPELTGRENIFLNGSILGMKKKEIEAAFDEIVAFAGLEQFLDVAIKRYSTGMYLRLAFAVAAHLQPEIILVDEVLAVGDADFQRKCMGKMDGVAKQGRTVVLVSHQLNAIRKLCKRCIWIDSGRLEMIGPTDQVLAAYDAAITRSKKDESRLVETTVPQFTDWSIDGSNPDTPNYVDTLGPVKVNFDLFVPTAVSRVVLQLQLWNEENHLMWGYSTDTMSFSEGKHNVSFALSGLPLRPGIYHWDVSIWDWNEYVCLDAWRAAPELIIATEPLGHKLDEMSGILNLKCELNVN